MATTVTPDREAVPGGKPAEPPLEREARKLGLPSATALVIGSIIGTGVFTMPAVMAGAGTSTILTSRRRGHWPAPRAMPNGAGDPPAPCRFPFGKPAGRPARAVA